MHRKIRESVEISNIRITSTAIEDPLSAKVHAVIQSQSTPTSPDVTYEWFSDDVNSGAVWWWSQWKFRGLVAWWLELPCFHYLHLLDSFATCLVNDSICRSILSDHTYFLIERVSLLGRLTTWASYNWEAKTSIF